MARWRGARFGFVSNAGPGGFDLDLACRYTGGAAVRAASEDGEQSPPPNDHHIRNADPRVRSLVLARPDIAATWTRNLGDPTTEVATPYGEWEAARAGQPGPGVWVEVRDGRVVAVAEQWVP